ncbi:MAG: arsenate reductase ArsC [Desulfamplus sp.]|nr:arsenate reductase ArsC [Desulfamplus sp.]
MEQKIKVLFICVHNSARSQMAEAFLKELGGGRFFVESAGLEAGNLNPLAVEVMKEAGIDISGNKTKSVFEFYKQGKSYNYVITVCDPSAGEQCPIFTGITKRLHWSFDDPSSLTGSYEEKLEKSRKIRDQIKEAVENLIKEIL